MKFIFAFAIVASLAALAVIGAFSKSEKTAWAIVFIVLFGLGMFLYIVERTTPC